MTSPRRSRLPAEAAAALLICLAGCYAPDVEDGTLVCAPGDRCPRGFVCRPDVRLCYRTLADAGAADVSGRDANGSDAGGSDAAPDARDGGEPAADAANPGDARDGRPPDAPADAAPDLADANGEPSGMDARDGRDTPADPDATDATGSGDVAVGPDGSPADTRPDTRDGGGEPTADAPSGAGLGSACTVGTQCASGLCVDGVCCDDACADQCRACDLPSARGTCAPVTSGPPHGTRRACGGDGTCGGVCSAASATACSYPGETVVCRTASCSAAVLTRAAACDGAGACPPAATASCGALACNTAGTACLTTCTADNQCATTARPYCDQGSCVAGRPNGARCASAAECAGQRCVDGTCCDDACQLPCQACDVAGHLGVCSPVPSGTPYGGRPACGGAGVCAGSCAGVASGQCAFPGTQTTCPCGLIGGTCNGAGDCRLLGDLCL